MEAIRIEPVTQEEPLVETRSPRHTSGSTALKVFTGIFLVTTCVFATLYITEKSENVSLLNAMMEEEEGNVDYPCMVSGAESFKPARGICAEQRSRLVEQFRSRGLTQNNFVIYLEGGHTQEQYYSDTELYFRQESNFLYLSGFQEAEALFILLPNSSAGWGALFVQRPTTTSAVWNGIPKTLDQYLAEYDVDAVYYTDQFASLIRNVTTATTVYTLPNVNFTTTQTRNAFAGWTKNSTNFLSQQLAVIRPIKTQKEMQVLRLATDTSGEAHIRIIQETVKQNLRYEYQIAGLFHEISEGCGGWTHQSYLSIVGAGPRSAVLHYNTNYEALKPGDMVLVDAGAEFFGYGTDITRTWPSTGKFTARQATLYNIVLASQNAALNYYKPGLRYADASSATNVALLEGLLAAGMVKGTVAQMLNAGINRLFLPHGIGHHVGLDVHDPGSLSVFADGMVVTCEPGLYFIPELLNPAFTNPSQAQYLNQDVIMQYWNETGVGGFRIEDMMYITSANPNGQEMMSQRVPRTVADIEAIANSGMD